MQWLPGLSVKDNLAFTVRTGMFVLGTLSYPLGNLTFMKQLCHEEGKVY